MDLPLSSFVFHFFLLTMQGVSLRQCNAASLWLCWLIACIFQIDCRDASLTVLFICTTMKWVMDSLKQSVVATSFIITLLIVGARILMQN